MTAPFPKFPLTGARRTALGLLAIFLGTLTAHADDAAESDRDLVPLTPEESAWIAAHPTIRVGHDPTYAPYAMQDVTGHVVGIDPDYLDLIARRTGLKFDNRAGHDWGEILQDFKDGRLDLLLSLNRDPARESYLTYTDSYASAGNVIVTRSDAPILSALEELQGRTVAVPEGDAGLRRSLEPLAGRVTIVGCANADAGFRAVSRGEVFATLADVAGASYYIRTHRVANLRHGRAVSASAPIYLGVRKDWPLLASILDKALASITAEDRAAIDSRWIAPDAPQPRWWVRTLRIAGIVSAVLLAAFVLVSLHNRRLARELAERRRIQAELEQTRDRLAQASQEKSELMHIVAHDLRSPLGAIQIGLELLLLNPPLAEPARSLAGRRVNESATAMNRLINDMLSVQNIEEGRFALKFIRDDAVQIAKSVVSANATVALHKKITIEAELPSSPVSVTTDFVALQQVVNNLMSNALKYSPPGTKVALALRSDGDRIRFEVRDQGPGVKPEERERIFEKFRRGSAQPTQGEKSTGLGLWIVRRFVAALDGRVWCEAGPDGVGSAFIVEVPVAPAAAA